MTELLTGHEYYRAYLHKYGHNVDESYPECRNEKETVKHVFFSWPKYVNQRNCLHRTVGFQVTLDNIVNLMISSYYNWYAKCVFARGVFTQQRFTERSRSAELEGNTH